MGGMADHHVFDRRAVRRHRDRAAATVHQVAPCCADCGGAAAGPAGRHHRRFTPALDIGGRGVVAPLLRARGLDVVAPTCRRRWRRVNGGAAVAADEEWLPFAPGSFDLVVASLSLHWVNDLPGALIQMRLALRPDGLLLASLPALGTLGGLRAALTAAEAELAGGASPRVSPFPDLRDWPALLQRAGFALPVADVDDMALSYATRWAAARPAGGGRGQCGGVAEPGRAGAGAVPGGGGGAAGCGGAGAGAAAAGHRDGVGAALSGPPALSVSRRSAAGQAHVAGH